MATFNYYLSKKPHGGFKVGEKVATYIAVNNEFLTGILRYAEIDGFTHYVELYKQ